MYAGDGSGQQLLHFFLVVKPPLVPPACYYWLGPLLSGLLNAVSRLGGSYTINQEQIETPTEMTNFDDLIA